MTKEDKIQVALGTKFICIDCNSIRTEGEFGDTAPRCWTCASNRVSKKLTETADKLVDSLKKARSTMSECTTLLSKFGGISK